MQEILELQDRIKKNLDKYYFLNGILIEFNYEKEFSFLDELINDANKVGPWCYIYVMFFIPISSISKGIRIDITYKKVGDRLHTSFEIIDNITVKEYKDPWWSIKVSFVVEKPEEVKKLEEKYNFRFRRKYDESLGAVFVDEIYMPLEGFVEPKVVIIWEFFSFFLLEKVNAKAFLASWLPSPPVV